MVTIARFEKAVRRVRKELKRLPQRPTVEQVHQLRTGLRRIESTLPLLAREREPKALIRAVKKLRRTAGGVRDMDVLTAYATGISHAGHTPAPGVPDPERNCELQLLEYLGHERFEHA